MKKTASNCSHPQMCPTKDPYLEEIKAQNASNSSTSRYPIKLKKNKGLE
jgi:hypothetical protein